MIRTLRCVSLLMLLLICAACSGGGSSTATTRVTLKLGSSAGGGGAAKAVFAGTTTAGSGYLPSIVRRVTITVSAPDMTDIVRSITVVKGQTAVVDSFAVPNGTGRLIAVTAQDNFGNTPYAGSTLVDLDGTDKPVDISMKEDVDQAITARLYQYFKETIEAKGAALTSADLDPFYATNFGIDDGETRAQAIGRAMKDYAKGIAAKGMVSLSVKTKAFGSAYAVMGKGTFSDGSFGFPEGGFTMVKEGGEWVIAGNGYQSRIEFRGHSITWLDGSAAPRVESGLFAHIEDPGNAGIATASLTGPGLPAGGVSFVKDSFSPVPRLMLGSTFMAAPPLPTMQQELYVMTDAQLSGIPAFAQYTFTLYDTNGAVVETRPFVLPSRPWLRSELTAGYFPTLAGITGVTAATDGHFLADARLGRTLGYTVGKPSAFAASWLETRLNYQGWDTVNKMGFWLEQELLLSDTSAAFSTVLPQVSIGGNLSVTANDFDNRRNVETVWLFHGPKSTTNAVFFGPTPVQAGGVTASPTAWTYGMTGPPPVVTWNGSLLTAAGVDVYLLADDPQRLATPQPSGDPFPGAHWVRLNPAAIAGSTGSFTLPVPPERLDVAGNGCRIMVVSTAGDLWGLSASFSISP